VRVGNAGRSDAGHRIKNKTKLENSFVELRRMRGSGSREKMMGYYFNKQYKHRGCITKRSTCGAWRGRHSKTRFRKIEGNIFPRFPLKAMSHADIICCALT
jgi:hypothetical protein